MRQRDFTKRTINDNDLSRMSAFLERDKVAFEEYALQVAVISFKHALSMESFNWGIKQTGCTGNTFGYR
jgi:hypothetical protein